LLSAFRQDQVQTRYSTFDGLLDYCRRSANPIGRLLLRLGRYDDVDNIAWSDSICTGLQLVNFWQDVRRDWTDRRRIYLPRETLEQIGVEENMIARGEATTAFRAAIAHEVDRAETFLHAGWPLVARASPELRLEVELFIRGGLAVAQAIRLQGYDVLTRRPVVGKVKKLRLFAAAAIRQKVFRRYGERA
jgi:squalene synthase HpnC